MFVMDCLSHVLANACNEELMDLRSDGGRLDTEVTRINMQ